ncbi:MAG: hypothetical protein ABSG67_01370 [Thermoguttaceae bacterium]|jgi:hypothetical protein
MKTLIALTLMSALTFPTEALIRVGRELGVRSIATGQQHPILQKAAENQAAYQARIHAQGHWNWESRVQQLYREMPDCGEFAEVCNQSWAGQDVESAAHEMYRSWRLSPGHWSAVNGTCDYWGYAMARGSNGIWYATGIFAKKRK